MTHTYTITAPDHTSDRTAGTALLAQAEALTVTDAATLVAAGTFLRACATARKNVEDRLKPAVDAAHRAHKELTTLRSELQAPFDRARLVVEPRVVEYQRAEQARLDAERREAEARARKVAEDAQLAAALEAEQAGHDDAAEAIMAEPAIVVAVPAAPAPKAEGLVTRVTYSANVSDLQALVRYVAANPAHVGLLLPNTVALNGLARALKGTMSIPGVQVVTASSLSVRTN